MRTVDHAITQEVPEALWNFIHKSCRIPPTAFHRRPAADLPERDRRLLVHSQDMTSTLAAFHGGALRVEVLRRRADSDLYLREVFLRTVGADAVVEYGVIAIALTQFTPAEQVAILAGEAPLGGLLHQFKIPFVSAPIGFFSFPDGALLETPMAPFNGSTCYGRFNRLAKATGEPLAWILEILPHA